VLENRYAFVLICFSILMGCEMPQAEPPNAVSDAAMQALTDYRTAERQAFADSDGNIVDRFSEDFLLISNGTPTITGRAAFRTHIETLWQTHSTVFTDLVDENIVEVGDLLVVSGRFDLSVAEKSDGEATTTNGRYLAIFRKDSSGQYELWREAALDGGSTEMQ
jgi:ketosteroid isomerase-like protein